MKRTNELWGYGIFVQFSGDPRNGLPADFQEDHRFGPLRERRASAATVGCTATVVEQTATDKLR